MQAAPGLPTLCLVRHGETAWSLTGQHTGSTDIPLTRAGEAMARGLAPMLQAAGISRVMTSPRQRARRTCELAMPGIEAMTEPDLAEWNYGRYEGLLTSDIWKTHPGWNVFIDECPGGETLVQVVERADRLLARLKCLDGTVALFSHGQFGCVLAARWAGLAGEAGEHLTLDPASLSILGGKPGHPQVPVITRWNLVPFERL
jgi:broad specificity phosphatase PhoE